LSVSFCRFLTAKNAEKPQSSQKIIRQFVFDKAVGWRIDCCFVSKDMIEQNRIKAAFIDNEIYGSDHLSGRHNRGVCHPQGLFISRL
jgi:hypothetical protein